MGKELTYHKTPERQGIWSYLELQVMGEVRTKHSGRVESLNMW